MESMLAKIWRLFSHHKGLGGDEAHPEVNRLVSGFMTPEMLSKLTAANGDSKLISDGDINVLDLSAGNWLIEGNLTNNLPLTYSFFLVDVAVAGSRKFITATQTGTGKIWTYVVNNDDNKVDNPNGWRRIWQEAVLFSGSVGKLNDSILLTDGIHKFEFFDIMYEYQGNHSLARITVNQLKSGFGLTSVNINNGGTDVGFSYAETSVSYVNNTQLKISASKSVNNNMGSSSASEINTANINIYRILGKF
ncbi:hypothetical protein [Enterococcus diestrammenae]|uniref:hypothetical protein n=1 Tax=Enterococcus diestrammenae TaxID=1155073 RepID=UPI0019560560